MHFLDSELFSGIERDVKGIWEALALLTPGITALPTSDVGDGSSSDFSDQDHEDHKDQSFLSA